MQLLVFDATKHADDLKRYMWLQNMLEHGFVGNATMSDQDLLKVIKRRGLTVESKAEEDEYGADDDHSDIHSLLQDYRIDSNILE